MPTATRSRPSRSFNGPFASGIRLFDLLPNEWKHDRELIGRWSEAPFSRIRAVDRESELGELQIDQRLCVVDFLEPKLASSTASGISRFEITVAVIRGRVPDQTITVLPVRLTDGSGHYSPVQLHDYAVTVAKYRVYSTVIEIAEPGLFRLELRREGEEEIVASREILISASNQIAPADEVLAGFPRGIEPTLANVVALYRSLGAAAENRDVVLNPRLANIILIARDAIQLKTSPVFQLLDCLLALHDHLSGRLTIPTDRFPEGMIIPTGEMERLLSREQILLQTATVMLNLQFDAYHYARRGLDDWESALKKLDVLTESGGKWRHRLATAAVRLGTMGQTTDGLRGVDLAFDGGETPPFACSEAFLRFLGGAEGPAY